MNLTIITKLASELRQYERNARTHSKDQVRQIAASITEFGFNNPILIDGDGQVIADHGRLAAAVHLGMSRVPCVVLDHMTAEQKRAYILADNRIAENAGWDQDLLALELGELQGHGFDLDLIGFSGEDLCRLFGGDDNTGLTDPNACPKIQPAAVSLAGDVWVLGQHRLMCGDSENPGHVGMLLAGGVPHLMVTDPPYGVEYDPVWRVKAGIGRSGAHGLVLNDNRADWSCAWDLFPGDVAYVWHAGSKANIVAESLTRCGFVLRSQIIWAKNQLVIGRGDYHPQHEPCWYAVRKGKPGRFVGNRKQTTVWRFVSDMLRADEEVYVRPDKNGILAISGDESTVWQIKKPLKSETGHSTQKPVECMARPIRNNSKKGDGVYEPFSGSGTTIIAAEQTGRRCYAMELSPLYVDVAVRRWQQFTGGEATLDGDGRTFGSIEDERSPEMSR